MPAAGPQVRAWCFTVHIRNRDELNDFKPFEQWEGVTYIVYQLEKCPETRRTHFQGYVLWSKKKTLAFCKKQHAHAHWEVRRGTHEQARDYCKKPESRVSLEHCYEFGDEPKPGQRQDLIALKADIDEGKSSLAIWDAHFPVMLKYHRGAQVYMNLKIPQRHFQTEVAVLYGPTGTGKTRWIHDNLPHAETYWVTSARSNGDPWMDGYDPTIHKYVVIDEFYGWIAWNTILRMLDRYPLQVETKGGQVQFTPRMIFITSNKPPLEWYAKLAEKGTCMDPLLRRLHIIRRYTAPGVYVEEKNECEDE